MKKKILFLLAAVLLCVSGWAQTTIFEDGFEDGNYGWTIAKGNGNGNSSYSNYWYLGTKVAATGTHSMYISRYSLGGTAEFDAWNVANTTAFSKSIKFPNSSQPFQLSFKWRGNNGRSSNLTVYLGNDVQGTYSSRSTTWAQANINLPSEIYSGNTFSLRFQWKCTGNYDADPFAIDDIKLTGTMTSSVTERTFNVSTAGSLNDLTDISISQVVKLTIVGNIDYRDLIFIRNNMPKLQELDINGANIVAYDTYPENEIPNEIFSMKTKLKSIILPSNITSIGNSAFSGCTGLTSFDIPSGVTNIGANVFSGCAGLTSITIPNSVTSIGNYAFYYCSGLTSIFIPERVKMIEDGTFSNCSKLASVTISENVTSIGQSAFINCTSLKNIYVNWANPIVISLNNVFGTTVKYSGITLYVPIGKASIYRNNNTWNQFNILPDQSEISCTEPLASGSSGTLIWAICNNTLVLSGNGAIPNYTSGSTPWYPYRTSIQSIEIGENITSIGSYAFDGCSGITSITVPANVYSIANYAFAGCSNLSSITFQTKYVSEIEQGTTVGVSSIGSYAFSGCNKLETIVIPSTVYSIADYGFAGCANLSSITFLTEERTIVDGDYQDTYIRGISSVGNNAFDGCSKLTSIVIPNSTTTIYNNAFVNCSGLENLTLGKGFKYTTTSNFSGLSFSGCNNLTAINVDSENSNFTSENGILYNKTKTILYNYPTGKSGNCTVPDNISLYTTAFNHCIKLTSVTIPNSVTTIQNYAFYGCSKLETITMPLKPIKNFTSGFKQLFQSAIPSSLKTIKITDDTDIPASFFQNANLGKVDMPLVKSVGNAAFSGCSQLKNVSARNASVSSSIFSACPLDTLTIGKITDGSLNKSTLKYLAVLDQTTESLPSGFLSGCSNLTDLTLPFIGTSSTATGENAILGKIFGYSSTGITQYYGENNYDKYAIPTTLKKLTITRPASQIGYGAFYGCNMLKEVTLPSTTRGVGEKAFYGCNGLEHIYSEWANPPAAYNNSTFEGVNKFAAIIHIPIGSKAKYSLADGWKEFFTDNIQEEAAVTIIARPVPLYGGIIDGTLQYNYDANAKLTASGNMGYDFQAWMEGENIVCTTREYSFTVDGARTLYAVFTPRENENEVTINTTPTEATIVWNGEAGASSYTLIIYVDAARTQEYARFEYDASGQILRAAQQNLSCNIPDLDEGMQYFYSLTSYDASNFALTISVGDFTTNATSGIEEIFIEQIKIYPNPVRDELRIKNDGLRESETVRIYNVAGQNVFNFQLSTFNSINVSSLLKGVYFVRAGNYTGKFVKE